MLLFFYRLCFDTHIANHACTDSKRCEKCGVIYSKRVLGMNNEVEHVCETTYCSCCRTYHDKKRGCYIKKLQHPNLKPYRLVILYPIQIYCCTLLSICRLYSTLRPAKNDKCEKDTLSIKSTLYVPTLFALNVFHREIGNGNNAVIFAAGIVSSHGQNGTFERPEWTSNF